MRKSHLFALLGGLILLAGGLWLHFGQKPAPNRMTQQERENADLLPSSEFLNVRTSMDFYKNKLRQSPDDAKSHLALAQLYLQMAKSTANEKQYVPLARASLAEALRLKPNDFHARALEASLFNVLHRFEDGEAAARRLLQQYPDNAFVVGVLIDALVEQGRYEEAVAASEQMQAIRPDMSSYARVSYLRELHGDTDGAIQAMQLAANAGVQGHEDRAWSLYHLGQLYLGKGDQQRAETIYRGLLEERPSFWRGLIGLAQIKLIEGKTAEATDLFQQAYDDAPSFDAMEGLLEAYTVAGNVPEQERMAGLLRQAFADAKAMGESADMEEADFFLDQDMDLPRALQQAAAEQRRRPGHLHANETYAWALFKNGKAREAIPYIERAMRLNTGDAMVSYRAARIYEAAGNAAKATQHYRAALENHVEAESPSTAAEIRAKLGSAARPTPAQP